jgi:hypothetical protein
MSYSQLRVNLVVAAGVVGASLLAATFVGCQTSPTSQAQNGPFGQYNGNQFAGAGAPNGQAASPFGASPQMASTGSPAAGWNPQSQQAFMNETQRLGTQPNLSAQDVVAMSRSGVPDQQIAMAIQQRGGNLQATPGMSQFLAQNGVNPAVLGQGAAPTGGVGQPAGFPNSYRGQQVAVSDPQASMGGGMSQSRVFNQNPAGSGVMPAGYPAAQADASQAQAATNDPSLMTPAFDNSGAAANGMNGQNWRPMPH